MQSSPEIVRQLIAAVQDQILNIIKLKNLISSEIKPGKTFV